VAAIGTEYDPTDFPGEAGPFTIIYTNRSGILLTIQNQLPGQ
jgi:hypothetical protein